MNASRKLLGGALAALFALLLGALFMSPASAESAYAAVVDGGDLSNSVAWTLDDEGELKIFPKDGNSGSFSHPKNNYGYDEDFPWVYDGRVKSVIVSQSVTLLDSAKSMFDNCSQVVSVDLSGLNTSSVTDMQNMFHGCSSLTAVNLSFLDTSNVADMMAMFGDCVSLETVNLSGLNTSSVTDASYLFAGCESLISINLAGWDTRGVSNMALMFGGGKAGDNPTQTIVLGPNFSFSGSSANPQTQLNDASQVSPYNGKWTNGSVSYTAEQLAANYNTSLAGVWYWEGGEPVLPPAAAPAVNYPTIPLTLTLEASKATNTAGMTFTFNPLQQPVVAEEEGAHAVPRWDSNDDGVIDSTDDYVLPQSTTLTAAAMDGYTQDITGSLALPDPALYGHAGVYAYEVMQQIPVSAGTWDYSEASYKVRVYVVNGEDGLEYAETPITIESIEDDEGDPVAKTDGYGPKVARMLFTNVNTATTNLQVTKDVTGAYGNHAKEFPFTLTVNLPSWASDDSFVVTTTGTVLTGTTEDSDFNTIVTTSSGTATITFNLAHGQSLSIAGLPVGTTFSTSETDSTDGVNVYVPSATYFYDGASNTGDFATNTTSYAAALDSNSVPATSLTVNATAAAANASTMLGEGTGNLVTVTNDLSNPPSPTGIATAVLPYAIMAAIAAGALLVLRNRKRDDDLA